MYIFIDESGIHNQTGRSTIALVYLSVEKLDEFQKNIVAVEEKIGINIFHWAHSTWTVRKKFIEAISKYEFSVKIALIKNPFIGNYGYEYVLQHLVIEKNIISIVIDGKKGKKYERRLKKVLRDKGVSIRKLKTAHDQSYPALRVADAIAGIMRYRDEHNADTKIQDLHQLISKKIIITLED